MKITISVAHGVCYNKSKLCDSKANFMASEIKRVLTGYDFEIHLHIYDQDHATWLNHYDARSTDYRKHLLSNSENCDLNLDIHSFDPEYHSDWRNQEIVIYGADNDLINFLVQAGVNAEAMSIRSDISQQLIDHNIKSLTIYINDRLSKSEIGYLARIIGSWLIS